MFETADELAGLQALLDASLPASTAHLRSIIRPERTLDADRLTRVLTGMCLLSVATVTAGGEPRVSAADGHFLHGRWVFGTAAGAAKARHLAARPQVSAAHLRGEELGVFVHGTAEPVFAAGAPPHPDWEEIHEYLTGHYGESPTSWGDIVQYRLRPQWMTVFAPDAGKLLPEP